MTTGEVARRILEEATEHAAWTAAWAADPVNGRAVRQLAKLNERHGTVSVYDDPVLSVRCSDLIALCAAVLEAAEPVDVDCPQCGAEMRLTQVPHRPYGWPSERGES